MKYHEPVLLKEVLKYLDPKNGDKFIDCTLGDGGHSQALINQGASVLGLDVSKDSIDRAKERIKSSDLFTVHANFTNLEIVANKHGFSKVKGILFDLGYSSYQLDEADIGLSFKGETTLDMRLDKSLGVTAADLLNKLPPQQLEQIIREYGGERMAKKFTEEVIKFRNLKKFQTTKDLADLLEDVAPSGYERGRIHPATRTFQALRIAVNDELENLKNALPQAARLLLPGGRLVIISFHSLEDKIAKSLGQHVQPVLKKVTKKPVTPNDLEVAKNVRARSAKMRVYERL